MCAALQVSPDTSKKWLRLALDLADEDTPFPWQEELFRRFANGTIDRSVDIPTGLGKTAVMAIWLVARACGATLPRRLIYIVDRRAVVDQATHVARNLRDCVARNPELKQALGLAERSLPISTLRGQHVDNKEWLEGPASPAIIVGTVDMIGSRLLFNGYGTSRKMRPYHAGLLGVDTLMVLDEAHLVPPFEKLLQTITDGGAVFGSRDEARRKLIPPFKLLSLSATGRAIGGSSLRLQDADLEHPVVGRRLDAAKRLTVLPLKDQTNLKDAVAKKAWELTGDGTSPVRCIIFCDKRKDAAEAQAVINKLAEGDKKRGIAEVKVDTQLFVGGRRVFEREEVAQWLSVRGFIAGTKVEQERPAFVFATSAGEVGVDLDADHMVSDLVAWERMVQRLGRVNRRGSEGDRDRKADVIVFEPETKPKKSVEDALRKEPSARTEKETKTVKTFEASVARARALRKPLKCLQKKDGTRDASPGAIRELKLRAEADPELQEILDGATSPAPLRPALSRALVDAWSMTSLKEHKGRPEIDPWLRGWVKDDPPQTAVVWRTYLPVRPHGDTPSNSEIEAFFEATPPHASELLETETFRVINWLEARAKALLSASNGQAATAPHDGDNGESAPIRRDDVAAVALTPAGDLRELLSLETLALEDDDKQTNKRKKENLGRSLAGVTLVVDARMGGLKEGLLNDTEGDPPRTVDDGAPWTLGTADETSETRIAPVVRFRVRTAEAGQALDPDAQWRERLRFATHISEEGEATRWLIVDKWCHDATMEDDRSAGRPQLLHEHLKRTEDRALDLARRLGLPDAYVDMLASAARLHDEGKQAKRWQRAFNATSDGVYAKTRGPINFALLDGYRHEFGSLPFAAKDARLRALPADLQDLALHLIAAHHGFARPVIGANGCEDAPPSSLEDRARVAALRFARLQKRWGPWGLAWWEALLRAADQQASRDNDAVDSTAAKESV